jgi:hypothetical protein
MRGALVGLAIVLALLTALYLMDDTLKDAEDIEKEFGIVPLTVIPESDIIGRSSKSGRENSKSKKHRKKKSEKEGKSK